MEKITRIEEFEFKEKKLKVEQIYYYDKENDIYYDDEELGNENLKKIRNAYRKEVGLLEDDEIKNIRDFYNLNQRNFSLLLGFGEVTITRYESKSIQDKAHDAVIRSATDPNVFLDYVRNNKESYLKYNSLESYNNLVKLLNNKITNDLSDSGNVLYDEEKFLAVICYINSKIENLTKTKLAKFLWYIDFKHFKDNGKSITGLTYVHNFYGAYPLGYTEKLSNKKIKIIEKYSEINDSLIYLIDDCKSDYKLSIEEEKTIDIVIDKFKLFNTKELVDYMHNEDAYTKTKQQDIINYKYSYTLSI